MDRLVWTHKVRLVQEAFITNNVIRWLNSTVGEEFRDWNLENAKLERRPVIMFRTGHQAETFRRRWPQLCLEQLSNSSK